MRGGDIPEAHPASPASPFCLAPRFCQSFTAHATPAPAPVECRTQRCGAPEKRRASAAAQRQKGKQEEEQQHHCHHTRA